jgi:hypothetical protein
MKSIKDIKKVIGYIEFRHPKYKDIICIPFYSIKKVKKGVRVETKQDSVIDELLKYSNFWDENNLLLACKPIKYGLIQIKRRKQRIEFGELNFGFLTDLVVGNNIYRFTLTL